ncbi:MAG: hypothetical protein AAF587_16085 [Bacteroidota bacterium]
MSNSNNAVLWQALNQARGNRAGSGGDPATNVYSNTVDVFDHENIFNFLDQVPGYDPDTINRSNILNAATLYATMVLGDDMGIFLVADVIMKYATLGHLDVESTTTATSIYRYMKLRDERTTPEERGMFYKQVFDTGDGETMEGMAKNDNFPALWETLMSEAIRYIYKYERVEDPLRVSKSAIRQVILDLQHNLSRAALGMVKIYVPEMYVHLENAIQIIDAPEVKDQLGHGVARDLWNVIESVSREEFGYYPNTSALRQVAANGRNIILDIADFNPVTFTEDKFQEFIRNIEAFIVAKGQIEGNGTSSYADNEREGDYRIGAENGKFEEYEEMEEDWNF